MPSTKPSNEACGLRQFNESDTHTRHLEEAGIGAAAVLGTIVSF